MSDTREWLNMQADMFAAQRRAEEAVKSANSWREEAKRLERERDALREALISIRDDQRVPPWIRVITSWRPKP